MTTHWFYGYHIILCHQEYVIITICFPGTITASKNGVNGGISSSNLRPHLIGYCGAVERNIKVDKNREEEDTPGYQE